MLHLTIITTVIKSLTAEVYTELGLNMFLTSAKKVGIKKKVVFN